MYMYPGRLFHFLGNVVPTQALQAFSHRCFGYKIDAHLAHTAECKT